MKKVNILFIAILMSISLVKAQDNDKNVTLTVSGSGKTQDEAKQSALRSAIEQAFGAFITTKTEILNDKIIADQITSVSSGNIKDIKMIYECQLPNGNWSTTLKAVVSITKLINFAESKGVTVEIKGGLFASNIKQQLLNEEAELNAICELVGELHEPMQNSFNYYLKTTEPKSKNDESNKWIINILVSEKANKTIDFCANYFINILSSIRMSDEEINSYKSLDKKIFTVKVNYKGENKEWFLRNHTSIRALHNFAVLWYFYTGLFNIDLGNESITGFDEKIKNGVSRYTSDLISIPEFRTNWKEILKDFKFGGWPKGEYNYNPNLVYFNFPEIDQNVKSYFLKDEKSLSQIEKTTNFIIKPLGVISQYKWGGYIISDSNNHGLIVSITDFDKMNFIDAKTRCNQLNINGYKDWRLPTKSELISIFNNFIINKHIPIGLGFDIYDKGAEGNYPYYWFDNNNDRIEKLYSVNLYNGEIREDNKDEKRFFLAIRSF